MKRWQLKILPPPPSSMEQFFQQLKQNPFTAVLCYREDTSLTVRMITDRNGDTHVLFLDVCQLLTVQGVVSNHVNFVSVTQLKLTD